MKEIPTHPCTRIILRRGELLLDTRSGGWCLPDASATAEIASKGEVFTLPDEIVASGCEESVIAPEGMEFVELRRSHGLISRREWRYAAKASELVYWSRQTRHCPRCGAALERRTQISMGCGKCGNEIFPSPAPAVLALILRGEEALLVRSHSFKRHFHGLVAGFVETGESLEECVRREVREETTLEIDDICYFGSQSWPFPFNLMVGFTARYAGGEPKLADGELAEANFYRRDALPPLPTPPSLARRMIDAWIEGQLDK